MEFEVFSYSKMGIWFKMFREDQGKYRLEVYYPGKYFRLNNYFCTLKEAEELFWKEVQNA